MHEFPPNMNLRLPTLLATTIGFVVGGNFTALEQIAIGNWIMQIGQTVMTNAHYQELVEKRIIQEENINLNSKKFKNGGSPFSTPPKPPEDYVKYYESFKSSINENDLADLQKAIKIINDELNKIKEELEK